VWGDGVGREVSVEADRAARDAINIELQKARDILKATAEIAYRDGKKRALREIRGTEDDVGGLIEGVRAAPTGFWKPSGDIPSKVVTFDVLFIGQCAKLTSFVGELQSQMTLGTVTEDQAVVQARIAQRMVVDLSNSFRERQNRISGADKLAQEVMARLRTGDTHGASLAWESLGKIILADAALSAALYAAVTKSSQLASAVAGLQAVGAQAQAVSAVKGSWGNILAMMKTGAEIGSFVKTFFEVGKLITLVAVPAAPAILGVAGLALEVVQRVIRR